MKNSSSIVQFTNQCKLYRLILGRDKKNLIIMMIFPILAAFVSVWITGKNMFVEYEGTKSGSFVIVSAAIWGGLFNTTQLIVKDRAKIKRDYIAGMKIRSYTASRALVQFILCIVQSFLLSISYVGISLKYGNALPNSGIIFNSVLLEFFISILLIMYSADSMGLMVSCMARKPDNANSLAPYILIIQLLFSGMLFPMEGYAEIVSYGMLSKWGMEALGSISRLNSLDMKIQSIVPNYNREIEMLYESTPEHLKRTWLILILFSLFFIFVGNLFLHSVSKDTR